MKLDIGAGRKPHKGYKTIDIESYANPDYLGDFREMTFSDVEVIRAHHILEHFSREEGVAVLRLWVSWLKDGGTLIIETPDIEYICKNWNDDRYWMTRHLLGSQESEWAFHRDGWYEEKFREVFNKIGLKITSVKRSKSRKILPNITVVAEKNNV